jgi:hypothetical protein
MWIIMACSGLALVNGDFPPPRHPPWPSPPTPPCAQGTTCDKAATGVAIYIVVIIFVFPIYTILALCSMTRRLKTGTGKAGQGGVFGCCCALFLGEDKTDGFVKERNELEKLHVQHNTRLGFHDPNVIQQLKRANDLEDELERREQYTYCCLICPSFINCLFFPCQDCVGASRGPTGCCCDKNLKYEGHTYKVDPQAQTRLQDMRLRPVGPYAELQEAMFQQKGLRILILSCPGDHYLWPGRSSTTGMHTYFSKHESKYVKFLPIQFFGNSDVPWESQVASDVVSRTYTQTHMKPEHEILPSKPIQARTHERIPKYEFWKAYWIANAMEALNETLLDYSALKLLLVKVHGGGPGSKAEEKNLEGNWRRNQVLHVQENVSSAIFYIIAFSTTLGLVSNTCFIHLPES